MRRSGIRKYGMGSNVLFMMKEAVGNVPSVLVLEAFRAAVAVSISTLELFITPVLLGKIEQHAPLSNLLTLIVWFIFGITLMRALAAYMEKNAYIAEVRLRMGMICSIVRKSASCSYPLMEDPGMQGRLVKVWDCVNFGSVTERIWTTLREILQSGIGFAIYLFLLKEINLFLILVTLVTTATSSLVTSYMSSWRYRHREEEADIVKKMHYVQGKGNDRLFAKDARIFGMEGWIKELMEKYQRLMVNFYGKVEKKYFLADAVDVMLAFLRNGIAYGYLLYITLQGGLGVSQFLLLFTAIGGFTEWVSRMMQNFTILHRQSLELVSLREFLDQEELFRMEDGIVPEVDKDCAYTIELKDVTFCYPGAERPVFEHLNLTIPAGEKLAVVGLNGAGKTTLVKLICGFYDPTQGEVLLNGVNIKEYNRREYYRLFAGVFQSFSILAGSILTNIAQTGEEADRDRALFCMGQAGLLEKIESLPKGPDSLLDSTVFNDAVELSGGELQRLMLARLLYRDSPIIVLDEPTAALDALAESDLYSRYQELTKGRTSIYISHRLASTRFCDRVILLKEGGILEEGTHEELMAHGGRYAQLFEIQSRYYREGDETNEQEEEVFA